MNKATAKKIVRWVRKQTNRTDIKDIMVDRFEIGYDEATLLILLSNTDFVV